MATMHFADGTCCPDPAAGLIHAPVPSDAPCLCGAFLLANGRCSIDDCVVSPGYTCEHSAQAVDAKVRDNGQIVVTYACIHCGAEAEMVLSDRSLYATNSVTWAPE